MISSSNLVWHCQAIITYCWDKEEQTTMGIKPDIKDNLKIFHITKINGQPTDEDLNKLESKLSEMAASISTSNEGGLHRHDSMIT